MATMQEQIAGLIERVNQLAQENFQLPTAVDNLTDRLTTSEQNVASLIRAGGPSGWSSPKGGLDDKNIHNPEKLENKEGFKKWAEDLHDSVAITDPDIATMLNHARYSKDKIVATGNTEELQKRAKTLYRMIKKHITFKEAKRIVILTPEKNPYEA